MLAALFHNVRSAYNVGAFLRSADGAGVSRLFFTGYTPLPVDRFGRAQKEVAKTALGAERFVRWEYAKDPRIVIERLRAQGWHIIGVEQDASAVDYRTLRPTGDTLFVFGSEVRGLSAALRRRCEALVEIPMRGRKESLNVSVAAGIIFYQFSS